MADIDTVIADFVAGVEGLVPQSESNGIWLVLTGALVFFMHCGFAMLEAGSVQKASVINIMFKNMGTVTTGGIFYWLLGFGFAYGSCSEDATSSFIGSEEFAYDETGPCGDVSAFYFFQFTFAATGATIVSGAVAERITLGSYFVVAAFITGFVFPVVTHWVWSSTGFMSAFAEDGDLIKDSIGLIDFAGSGVVHLTGGSAALMGALIIGPRAGKFVDGKAVALAPSSYTLQTLGTLILWFGWYGFNCGSTLVFDGVNISKAAITTTLAPSAAAVTAIIYCKIVRGYYDLPCMLNSILAGLVAITAGCTAVADWAALIIGIIGALSYISFANLVEKLGIDDPIGASAVHGAAGFWGVFAVGIFSDKDAIADSYSAELNKGPQFAMQLVGPIIIMLWSASLVGLLFFGLKKTGLLRVSPEVEAKGLDESEHGGAQILHF